MRNMLKCKVRSDSVEIEQIARSATLEYEEIESADITILQLEIQLKKFKMSNIGESKQEVHRLEERREMILLELEHIDMKLEIQRSKIRNDKEFIRETLCASFPQD